MQIESPKRSRQLANRCSRSDASKRDSAVAPSAARPEPGTPQRTGPSPTMHDPRRVAILISGRGSNMRALVDRADAYEVVLVASIKPGDTPQMLEERVLAAEHLLYPKVLSEFVRR